MTANSIQQHLSDRVIEVLNGDLSRRLINSECLNKQYELVMPDICNNKFDIAGIINCSRCSECKYRRFNRYLVHNMPVNFLKCDTCSKEWCSIFRCNVCFQKHDCASENIAFHEEMGEMLCVECYGVYLQNRL